MPWSINRLLHGLHFDMGFINEWHMSYHERVSEWAQRTSEWYDMTLCHKLIKPISKCNPCNNLFITYHIQGIVRMYQCVRNAILSYLMITITYIISRLVVLACSLWHSQWLILCYARQTQHIVYVMFVMFSNHSLVDIGSQCERVPGNRLLFIESMWCLLNNLPRVLQ